MNIDRNRSPYDKNISREVISWVIDIAIVIVCVYLITTFVAQRNCVDGQSMEPTLHNEDQLVIDKISYRFTNPKRFDIIVFPYRMNPEQHYIKRIIGLPGETIQIKDSKIYINGEELKENYGLEAILSAGVASEAINLQEDEYFVMGDNRNNSNDSREVDVGNINRHDIIGKAWLRIWPIDDIGFIKHE